MGWMWLFAIGLAAFALLWLGGISRSLAMLTAAALLVGAAGYALQQNAGLPGRPVSGDVRRIKIDPLMVAFRTAIMPGTADDQAILAAADEKMRGGDTAGAVRGLLDAIGRRPGDATLWSGLGSALVAHDKGQLSPAAQFAFRRAIELAPDAPGPAFFFGVAYVQAGDLAAARRWWLRALTLSPRDASYRILIAERLVMVDRLLAMQAGAARPAR